MAARATQENTEPPVKLVEALCTIGWIDKALAITLEHLEEDRQGEALTAVVQAYAASGWFGHVERLFARHDFVTHRTDALVRAAEAAALAGERKRAAAWLRTA